MKKLLFLSSFLLFASILHGQTWFAPDYRWSFNISGGFAGIDEDLKVQFDKDTAIHGLPCRKWAYQIPFPWAPHNAYNFTYSDGPRTYIYSPELDSLVKMYDFSLPVGAQVQVPRNTGVFTYQIEAIDQVGAGNLTLLRQYVRYI
ncbi:MAG: hypothetical protein JNJ57_19510, partial [Saprospiraceae bacterium]|nr:hypothetical protein [Saprospiraceae bacterium]